MFIGASTLVCLLGWSTVSNHIVAKAAPMVGNPHYMATFQTGMNGERLLDMWLQFRVAEQKNGQQNNGLHLGQQKNKQNNGLHLGQLKNKDNNELQLEQQSFFNIISEVADILDVDEETIIDELQDGSTLVEIAKSHGVSKSTLLADLKDRIDDAIDDAVKAGTITEAQAAEMKSKLTDALKQVLENKFNNLSTSLSAPDNLTATAESDDEISLDWDSVTDATSYYVFRSTSYYGTYTKIATVTTTNYIDDNLAYNTAYYYKVQAVNSSGSSVYSSVANATTGDESDSDLDAPDDLTATAQSDSEISLDWDSVTGATSYYVYRATSSSGTYTKIATVTTSSYTDDGLTADRTYYYKIKAHSSTDTSDYSSGAHATTDEED
jgi:hypothetical protein